MTPRSREVALGRLIGVGPDATIEPTSPVDQTLPEVADFVGQPPAALASTGREQRGERLSAAGAPVEPAGERERGRWPATRPTIGALAGVQPARPNQRFVPKTDQWKTLVGSGRERDVAAVGRRASQGRRCSRHRAGRRVRSSDRTTSTRASPSRSGSACSTSTPAARRSTASDEAVAAATEAHRVVAERFNAGVATSTDVLDAQLALLQAELERTQLMAALRVNEARLLRAVGSLLMPDAPAVILVDHLTRRFGEFRRGRRSLVRRAARRGVRFSRRNGAGKSTTIRMLCGLLKPTRRPRGRRRPRRRPRPRRREAPHRLHVAALLALRTADGRPEHHVLRRAVRAVGRSARACGGSSSSTWPASPGASTSWRATSRAAGGSGWRSAARCCTSRRSSSSTSRPAASIPCRAATSGASSTTSPSTGRPCSSRRTTSTRPSAAIASPSSTRAGSRRSARRPS